jgi:alpha-1,3-rhamnosyltransferase
MEDMLISVVVISYNSSPYIEETLQSVYDQAYPHIELIVSDDGSKDGTLGVVESWLEGKEGRFARVELVGSIANTGISPNVNRGVKKASGEWVKIIAGDDLLHPSCIELCVEVSASLDEQVGLIHGMVQPFFVKDGVMVHKTEVAGKADGDGFYGNTFSQQQQLFKMLSGNYVAAPSVMYRRSSLLAVGLFDEAFPFMEDYPMHIKLLSKGYKLYYIPQVLALYRISDSSISHRNSQRIFSTLYLDSYYSFVFSKLFPVSSLLLKLRHRVKYAAYRGVVVLGKNRQNIVSTLIIKLSILLTRLIDKLRRYEQTEG